MMRLPILLFAPLIASAASAQTTVKVANRSDTARQDALVRVPAKDLGASDIWSVKVAGRLEPAQRIVRADGSAEIVFMTDLPAHGTLTATLLPKAAPSVSQRANAVLNIQTGSHLEGEHFVGGKYKELSEFDVPDNHLIHDNLIAFEGPGWESDRVAYRLYLDGRNVTDIFGKKLPASILGKIGMGGDDYHVNSDWGMDIFQVDQSLGVGGLGTVRNGRAEQIGPSKIATRVEADGPVLATVRVDDKGWQGLTGPVDLTARYSIAAGSRLTHVTASLSDPKTPLVAGLTHHLGVSVIKEPATTNHWGYVASYGKQSLAKDNLGIVLFYPPGEGVSTHDDGRSLYIRFSNPREARYAFAAAWEEEPAAPKTESEFRTWIASQAAELAMPVEAKSVRE